MIFITRARTAGRRTLSRSDFAYTAFHFDLDTVLNIGTVHLGRRCSCLVHQLLTPSLRYKNMIHHVVASCSTNDITDRCVRHPHWLLIKTPCEKVNVFCYMYDPVAARGISRRLFQ